MKRLLIALGALGILGAAAIGSAAGFSSFSGGSVQSGSDTDLTCTSDAVSVSYTVVWDSLDGEFDVEGATVSGLGACTTASIQLTGTSLDDPADGPTTVVSGEVTFTDLDADAEAVTDVHVVAQ